MSSLTVSVPGKLILLGEHAVVYGRPALVAAIDLRLSARFADSPEPGVRLDLPNLAAKFADSPSGSRISWNEIRQYARGTRDRWGEYSLHPDPQSFREMRGEDPAHVVKAALGEALDSIDPDGGGPDGENPDRGLDLRVESGLPIGSGFGSSAATAVAVLSGFFAWSDAPIDDPRRIESLALEVERRQHGHPSGVDGATILRGGVLWARKRLSGGLAGELDIETVRSVSPLLSRVRVYDSGTPPEATGAVVAAVRRLREGDPARFEATLDRIEAATAAFRTELERGEEDRDRVLHLLRDAEACLEELGVVPEAVRAAVRQIENAGGAAKVSGAGSIAGPGAGSLLVYHPEPERLQACAALRPFPYHAVHLGAPGFRQETG